MVATIKSLKGLANLTDQKGEVKPLKVGDTLAINSVVHTLANSSALVELENGKTISLGANESLKLDKAVVQTESFGDEALVLDVASLQQAILNSENLADLEATAAGAGEGGASLSPAEFATSGHESSVTSDFDALFEPGVLAPVQAPDNTAAPAAPSTFGNETTSSIPSQTSPADSITESSVYNTQNAQISITAFVDDKNDADMGLKLDYAGDIGVKNAKAVQISNDVSLGVKFNIIDRDGVDSQSIKLTLSVPAEQAVAGASVKDGVASIEIPFGTSEYGEIARVADGSYVYTPAPSYAGLVKEGLQSATLNASVRARGVGDSSDVSASASINIDTLAPAGAAVFDSITNVSFDNKDGSQIISGTIYLDEKGASIIEGSAKLLINGAEKTPVLSAVLDSDGKPTGEYRFSYTAKNQELAPANGTAGVVKFSALAKDMAGNVGAVSSDKSETSFDERHNPNDKDSANDPLATADKQPSDGSYTYDIGQMRVEILNIKDNVGTNESDALQTPSEIDVASALAAANNASVKAPLSNDSTPEFIFTTSKEVSSISIRVGDTTYTYPNGQNQSSPAITPLGKDGDSFKFSFTPSTPLPADFNTSTIEISATDKTGQNSGSITASIVVDNVLPDGSMDFESINPDDLSTGISATYSIDDNSGEVSIKEGSFVLSINGREISLNAHPEISIRASNGKITIKGLSKERLGDGLDNKDGGNGKISLKFTAVDGAGNEFVVDSDKTGDKNDSGTPDGKYIYDDVLPVVSVQRVVDNKAGDTSKNLFKNKNIQTDRVLTNDEAPEVIFSVQNKFSSIEISLGGKTYEYGADGELLKIDGANASEQDKSSAPTLAPQATSANGEKSFALRIKDQTDRSKDLLQDGDQDIRIVAKDGTQTSQPQKIMLDIDTNQVAKASLSVPEISSTAGSTELSVSIVSNDNPNPDTQGHDHSGSLASGTLTLEGAGNPITYKITQNKDGSYKLIKPDGKEMDIAIPQADSQGKFSFDIPVSNKDLINSDSVKFTGIVKDSAGNSAKILDNSGGGSDKNNTTIEPASPIQKPATLQAQVVAIRDNVKGGVEGDIKTNANASDGSRTNLSNDSTPSIEFKFMRGESVADDVDKSSIRVVVKQGGAVLDTITQGFSYDKNSKSYSIELPKALSGTGEYSFEISAKDMAGRDVIKSSSDFSLDTAAKASLSELGIFGDENGAQIDLANGNPSQIVLKGRVSFTNDESTGDDKGGTAVIKLADGSAIPNATINLTNGSGEINLTITDPALIDKILKGAQFSADVKDVAGNESAAASASASLSTNAPAASLSLSEIGTITSASGEKTSFSININGLDRNEKLSALKLPGFLGGSDIALPIASLSANNTSASFSYGSSKTGSITKLSDTQYKVEVDTADVAKFKHESSGDSGVIAVSGQVSFANGSSPTDIAQVQKPVSINLQPNISVEITQIEDVAGSNKVKVLVEVSGLKDGEKLTTPPKLKIDQANGSELESSGTPTKQGDKEIYTFEVDKSVLANDLDKAMSTNTVVATDKFELTTAEGKVTNKAFSIDGNDSATDSNEAIENLDINLITPKVSSVSNDGSSLKALEAIDSAKAGELKGKDSEKLNDPTPTINGSATPNTHIAIYAVENKGDGKTGEPRLIGVGKADEKGEFSITPSAEYALNDGSYTLVPVNVTFDTLNNQAYLKELIQNSLKQGDLKSVTIDTDNSTSATQVQKVGGEFKFEVSLDKGATKESIKVFKHNADELASDKYSIGEVKDGKVEIKLLDKPANGEVFDIKSVDDVGNVATASTIYKKPMLEGTIYANGGNDGDGIANMIYQKFNYKYGSVGNKDIGSLVDDIVAKGSYKKVVSAQSGDSSFDLRGKTPQDLANKMGNGSEVANKVSINNNGTILAVMKGDIEIGEGQTINNIYMFGKMLQGYAVVRIQDEKGNGQTIFADATGGKTKWTMGNEGWEINYGLKGSYGADYRNDKVNMSFSPLGPGKYTVEMIMGVKATTTADATVGNGNDKAQNAFTIGFSGQGINGTFGTVGTSKKGVLINGDKEVDNLNDNIIDPKEQQEATNHQEIINANKGNDTIDGYGGEAANKPDIIHAQAGDDTITLRNNTQIDGGSGKDTLKVDGAIDLGKLSDNNAANGEARDVESIQGSELSANGFSAENIQKITGSKDDILKIGIMEEASAKAGNKFNVSQDGAINLLDGEETGWKLSEQSQKSKELEAKLKGKPSGSLDEYSAKDILDALDNQDGLDGKAKVDEGYKRIEHSDEDTKTTIYVDIDKDLINNI